MRQTLALVGVVITLLGALMAFSQVPLLVSPPPCGSLNCPPPIAHTSFFVVQSNYTVTVHDTTKLYVSPCDPTIYFGFHDGSHLSSKTIQCGGEAAYNFTAKGNYTILDSFYLGSYHEWANSTQVVQVPSVVLPCSSCNEPSIVPFYSWTLSGLTVTVTDGSTLINTGLKQIVWSWGDNTSSECYSLGCSLTHTYVASGSYDLTETVISTNLTAFTSYTIHPQVSPPTCTSNCTPPPTSCTSNCNATSPTVGPAPTSPSAQSLAPDWGLAFLGLGVIAVALVPMNRWMIVVTLVGTTVVGYLIGAFFLYRV